MNRMVVSTEINKEPQHLLMQVFQLHLIIDNRLLPSRIYGIFVVCVSYIVNIEITVLKMASSVSLSYFYFINMELAIPSILVRP